jgi:hypothetical protein
MRVRLHAAKGCDIYLRNPLSDWKGVATKIGGIEGVPGITSESLEIRLVLTV